MTVSIEVFETPRLTAEKLRDDHLADLVKLHLDEEVSRYLGGVRSAKTTKAYLATNRAHWDEHGFGLWVLRTRDGAFAGRAGIRHIALEGVAEIEIAYTFKRTLWSQGLASEVAEALTEIGFTRLGFCRLVGVVAVDNVASRRVLEKSGYELERAAKLHGEPVVIYRHAQSG